MARGRAWLVRATRGGVLHVGARGPIPGHALPPHQGLHARERPEGVPKTRGAAALLSSREVVAYHEYWVRIMHSHPDGPYHGPKIPGNFVG